MASKGKGGKGRGPSPAGQPAPLEFLIATRPWSFTATFVPVILANCLAALRIDGHATLATGFSWVTCMVSLFGMLAIHAAGNLTNTYYDFVTGNDRRETSGDRTLFDYNLKLWHVGVLTLISYSLALLIGTYALAIGGLDLLWLFVVGLALTYSYTATPFKLKARALGDLVILLCFGPLPMLGIYFMHTRVWSFAVFLHSLPVGMLAVAILHTNNARDVTSDRKANATTLAQLLGREGSYYFYMALLGVSYAMVLLLEFTGVSSSHRATSGASRSSSSLLAFLPFAALPIARKLLGKFKAGQFETLTEETAQFAFLFGVLWIAVFVVRLVL